MQKYLTSKTQYSDYLLKYNKFIFGSDILSFKDFNEKDESIDINKVKIVIDPLDATFSLINKKYYEVSIIVTVLYKDKPIVGIVCVPFHKSDAILTYFNYPKKGLYRIESCDNAILQLTDITDHVRKRFSNSDFKLITSYRNIDLFKECRIK